MIFGFPWASEFVDLGQSRNNAWAILQVGLVFKSFIIYILHCIRCFVAWYDLTMKFSIKFLGIIALSDATQAAFIPATTNTTNVARANSTKKTGGPQFPVKVRRSCIPTMLH
jgi:hypothetical protein